MERFIRRENIKRRRIQKLLIKEEQKESAAETPSTAPRLSDGPLGACPL
jgi:hypothetical protein